MKKIYALLTIILLTWHFAKAQDQDSIRLATVRETLAQAVGRDSLFRREVDVSIGKIAISELLRNIAKTSEVNISVRGLDNVSVSCNFNRAKIDDLLYFLCKEYKLDVELIGNIVSIKNLVVPVVTKEPQIEYDTTKLILGYDLAHDKLIDVVKKITNLSGHNIIIPQSLYDFKISGYVKDMPFDDALYTLASVNSMIAERDEQGIWSLYNLQADSSTPNAQTFTRRRQFTPNELSIDSLGRITAHIGRGSVQDIITDLCDQQGINYYFESPINQQLGIYITNTDFETLLGVLLSGTQHSYYMERGIYIFGSTAKEGALTSVRVIPLAFRAVSKIDEAIPTALKTGLQVQKFADLNSIIISGDQRKIARVESFIKSIDKPVPLITIEIIIADVTKSNIQEVGIGLGVSNTPVKTSGTLSPGVDMTLNAQSLNKIINSINGFGSVNLGKVASSLYMSLQFLEENGNLKLQSTPKLSTLNGQEATLKSGETKYYKEIQNNYIGTQNPIQSESYTWKSVDANLSVKITPFVSLDRTITLDIEIEQTEFTSAERVNEETPPGTATRSFKSIVKVQNEEVVLLGGIDRNTIEKSSKGLPFIARVPVLRWLFGKHKDNRIDRKLNLFIKPTIVE